MFSAKKRIRGLRYSGGDQINNKSTSRPIAPTHTKPNDRFVAVISVPFHSVENDNRPHATVKIFDSTLTGLLDSGANVTVLGQGSDIFLEKWAIDWQRRKNSSVHTADGSKLKSKGTVTLPVEYNGKRRYITAIIVPDISKTLILGMDFWQAFGISLSVNALTLEEAIDITTQSNLSSNEKSRLSAMLAKFDFAKKDSISFTDLVEHTIDVGDTTPFMQRQYPVSPYIQEKMYAEIDRMLALGIIERTTCPKWLNPVISVPKKNDTVRLVIDARKLNEVTKRTFYSSRNTNEILSRMRGSKFLSTIDLSDAYYQIKIAEPCRDYTAFKVGTKGTFRYVRMAMGLCNSASTWCELVDRVIGCDLEPECFSYMDDFVIATDSFERHLFVLETLLSRLNNAGLRISAEKSFFCRDSINFLGYIITSDGVKCNEEKVKAIVDLPRPTSIRKIRQFIGMVGWHDAFINHYSTLLAPITDLLKNAKDPHAKPKWTSEAEQAFIDIKKALINAPVLALPDYKLPFEIHTDASNVGIGAMITQQQNGINRVIAYYSAKLTPTQQRYMTTEKECLAVIMAIEKFRIYVQGIHFTVYTDHASLIWLNRFKDSNGRLVRWALRLQQYNFTLKHRKGSEMKVPDTLSRMFEVDVIDFDSFQTTSDATYLDLIDKTLKKHPDASAFTFENDLLYRLLKRGDRTLQRLYVPIDRIEQVLTECHDDATAAHGGFFKTRHRVREFYFWPNMDADIRKHIQACHTCKANKCANYNQRNPMGSDRSPKKSWDIISIDFIGPYPRSNSGHKYILTIVDYFSKFTIITPCRDATAAKLIETVEQKVFLTYGVPAKIICDNGTQFRSKAFAELCKSYNTHIWFTPVYSPQNNPSEACNKIIGSAIRCYINNKHKEWDKHLPKIQCAINSSCHTATHDTPFSILYGHPYALTNTHKQLVINCNDSQRLPSQTIQEEVTRHLKNAYESSKKRYDLRSRPTTFSIGDTVYRRNFQLSNKSNDFSAKLAPKYVQCSIVKRIGNVYHVRDTDSINISIFHAKDLKKC